MNDLAPLPVQPRCWHLPYRQPWDWKQFHQHFQLRLLPGIERLTADGYSRSVRLGDVRGWLRVRPLAERPVLELTLSPSLSGLEQPLIARVRRMFDLDADPAAIGAHLGQDPLLASLIARYPGLRLPTAFDPFEQAVRAIVGQQVAVKAAITIVGRLVGRLGEPLDDVEEDGPQRLFPTPDAIADDPLEGIGMPGKRVETLRRLARAVRDGELALHVNDGAAALVERLCALPGIGPWTAEYIALRAFGETDAFPASDLGLLKAPVWGLGGTDARTLAARSQAWRPWRAYAAVYLWQSYAET